MPFFYPLYLIYEKHTRPPLGERGHPNWFIWVMLIRSTAHPSYCPSAILPIRPTATSDIRQLFIIVLLEG